MSDTTTYLVDLVIRGKVSGSEEGQEPVISATRIGIRIPNHMNSTERAYAIGEEIRKVGAHLRNKDELASSIKDYDEALLEVEHNLTPPEHLPN